MKKFHRKLMQRQPRVFDRACRNKLRSETRLKNLYYITAKKDFVMK